MARQLAPWSVRERRWLAVIVAALLSLGAAVPAATADAGTCGALEEVVLPDGRVLCTHGADTHPADLAGPDMAATDSPRGDVPAVPVPGAPIQCYGDGASSARVQVLTVHAAGVPFEASDGQIRSWIEQVEWTFNQSAARDGGRRHVRWATEADPEGGCRVAISDVVVSPEALVDFQATVTDVAEAGYARGDRKYLMFVATTNGVCGLGTAPADDRPTADNAANTTVGYARIDSDCWTTGDEGYYSVAAHELSHTFGGVQTTAPHGTTLRHCTDEWDVLCYDDDGPQGEATTQVLCEDDRPDTAGSGDLNDRLLDCHGDDYFNAGTPSGWLATHWNVANSVFLATTVGDGPGYDTRPPVEADPQNRPRVWSGRLGTHRPLLRDAYGWEACDLPISVAVADDGGGSVLGVLGAGSTPLRDAAESAVAWVNEATGTTVLQIDPDAESGQGIAVIDSSTIDAVVGQPMPTRVVVQVADARIASAAITVDEARVGDALDIWVTQAVVQALGIGHNGVYGDLMSPWPTTSRDQAGTGAALAHLYGPGACSEDRRLDDTVPGHPSQRRHDRGVRERVDLAAGATTPVEVGVQAAAWLRDRNGSSWAATAVICRDDVHADCLAGAPLAGRNGPILFVPGGPDGTLPAAVRDELRASVRPGASVFLLGGERAVSAAIEEAIRTTLPDATVIRLAGRNRYATATAIADRVLDIRADARSSIERSDAGKPLRAIPAAILARADDPVDAVAAGAYAAAQSVPVVLSDPAALPDVTARWLEQHPGTTVLLGGRGALSPAVEGAVAARTGSASRISGPSRFETAIEVARHPALWDQTVVRPDAAGVVGLNGRHASTWVLALAAAPVAAELRTPVLYTDGTSIPASVRRRLADLPLAPDADLLTVYVGGGGAFGSAAVADLWHAEALPGFDGNVTVSR